MGDLSKLLERAYAGFLLRDILGFLVPGAISVISLWSLFHPQCGSRDILSHPIVRWYQTDYAAWRVVAFLVASYVVAWTLQTILYLIVNLLSRIPFLRNKLKNWCSDLTAAVRSGCVDQVGTTVTKACAMTLVSLESDRVVAGSLTDEALARRLEDFPYSERLSALAIMSSNLAIALGLLTWSIARWPPCPVVIASALACIVLYVEYWRLTKARILQIAVYAVEWRKRRKDRTALF